MRALDRVVDDAHPQPILRLGQDLLDRADADRRPQVSDDFEQAQRDVDRMPRRELGPAQM
jgi:hypothetical protein